MARQTTQRDYSNLKKSDLKKGIEQTKDAIKRGKELSKKLGQRLLTTGGLPIGLDELAASNSKLITALEEDLSDLDSALAKKKN